MKKHLLVMTAFLAVMSCEKTPETGEYPVPESGASYVLEGTVNTEGFTWKTNSIVGLYSSQADLRILNKECKIAGWADTTPKIDEETGENLNKYTPSEYEGKSVARFNTPPIDLVQGENKFMVYYPYDKELAFVDGKILGLNIGDKQTQSAPNVASDCFSVGTMTGIPGMNEVFSFSLNPVTALAKVHITSSELSSYSPVKVTIFDESSTPIAGDFDIDVNNMTISPIAGSELSQVSVEIVKPSTLGETKEQNIYLNILSADYTSKPVWIVIDLVDEKNGKKITIPVQKTGFKFDAGKTTTIDLSNLKTSDNGAGEWYCPDDTRLQAGEGVAYGEANTYFIQYKGGTYKGASLSPNSKIPSSVEIDYRARGNFAKAMAAKPENVTFEWLKTSKGAVYASRTANYEASEVVVDGKFTIEHKPSEHKVIVTNTGAFAGTPILIMKDATGKILWAWTFWNIAADGTTIDPITVGDYKFAPMDIGQPTTDIDKWIANKTSAGLPDPIFRMTHLYQWGRPVPIFWTTYWTVDGPDGFSGNIPGYYGQITVSEALGKPGIIINRFGNEKMYAWCSDTKRDLWGVASSKDKDGMKSIYDPCPKGWRVASRAAIEALTKTVPTYSEETGKVYAKFGNLVMINQGYVGADLNLDPAVKKEIRITNTGGGVKADKNQCKYGFVWSNASGKSQAEGLYYTLQSLGAPKSGKFNVAAGAAVRCIVDEDNR